MIFALLTLLTALSLATVAGWFSIVGFMAIYAGAPMYALIMGVVTEVAKLVTASWLYRNWEYSDWKLKIPLLYFTAALMVATSIGVFGFLSKAHLEQSSGTLDNSSRIETLNYQIQREKNTIADNEKVTAQLDATVNSMLGKDRADRALSVRRSQATSRNQLRADSEAAQKRIDTLSEEKFKLESEVRKMELEVGPIRYIAELFYGVEENTSKNIEAAVRIFTLLLVSTLDPLAVILLIAANHTLLRLRNEKNKTNPVHVPDEPSRREFDKADREEISENTPENRSGRDSSGGVPIVNEESKENKISFPVLQEPLEILNEEKKNIKEEDIGIASNAKGNAHNSDEEEPIDIIREILENSGVSASETDKYQEKVPEVTNEEIKAALEKFSFTVPNTSFPVIRQPSPSKVLDTQDGGILPKAASPTASPEVNKAEVSPTQNGKESVIEDTRFVDPVIRELRGNLPHFVPKKVHVEKKEEPKDLLDKSRETQQIDVIPDKYPRALSWLSEFKRS